MKEPTSNQFDKDRKEGYRPSVLCCCVNEGRILFLNKRDYGLWMFPQGGIDNGEDAKSAISRELEEELGEDFTKNTDKETLYFGEFLMEFPEKRHGADELKSDDGKEVLMKGKKFYFYAVAALTDGLDISKTEFNDYFWLPYDTAMSLAAKIYQVNKRAMVEESLKLLKKGGLIS